MTKTTQPDYATPGLLRRFAAMVYDTLLLMAVSMLYGAVVLVLNLLVVGTPQPGSRASWGHFNNIVFLGWIATLLFFFCYFWHKSGQTLGMKTWRIKITTPELGLPSYPQCLLRCLLAPFSLFFLGAGYWWMYADAERQTWHDRLTKTRTHLLAKEKK